MRVVLDTNIFVSALISSGSYAARAFDLWTNKAYDLVTSHDQIEELRRVSRYEHLKDRLRRPEVGALVNALRYKAIVVNALTEVNYSPDPDDNVILASNIGNGHRWQSAACCLR